MATDNPSLSSVKYWNETDVSRLVNDGIQPDFWEETNHVTFKLLNSIIEACELTGKPLKHALPPALKALKPHVSSIPNIGTINVERRRRKNVENPSNIVQWLEATDHDYIGPYCDAVGIRMSTLNETISTFANEIHPINNGVVLELKDLKTNANWRTFLTWLVCLRAESQSETEENLRNKITKLAIKRSELFRAKKHDDVRFILNATYDGSIPAPVTEPYNIKIQELQNLERAHIALRRQYEKRESQLNSRTEDMNLITAELKDLRKDTDLLLKDLESERKEKQRTEDTLIRLRNSHKRMEWKVRRTIYWSPYNSQRRQRRKELQIEELKLDKQNLISTLSEVRARITKFVEKNTRMRKKLSYYKNTLNKLKLDKSREEGELITLKRTIKTRELEAGEHVREMEDASNEHFTVPVMEDRRYTDALRSTAIQLHSAGVGIQKITKCIDIVGREIFKVCLGKLPSNSTLKQFVFEGNVLGKFKWVKHYYKTKTLLSIVTGQRINNTIIWATKFPLPRIVP